MIVLNHLQTRDLIRGGKALGQGTPIGKAFASGTQDSVRLVASNPITVEDISEGVSTAVYQAGKKLLGSSDITGKLPSTV